MRTSHMLLFCLLVASGCGSTEKTITVGGHVLKVVEQNYGTAGTVTSSAGTTPFCQPLASNQFEIVITDFAFCSGANKKQSNTLIFHSSDETNMRLIVPSDLQKNPNGTFMKNTFNVASTGGCKSAGGQPATAFFSHNSPGQTKYDLNLEASSGSISITGYDGQSFLQGDYDLIFNKEHIVGTFEASFCSGLNALYGL